jgi:hypothetical protein
VLIASDTPRTSMSLHGLAMVGTMHALNMFDVLSVSHDPLVQVFFALSCTVLRRHLVCLCWPTFEPSSSLFSVGEPCRPHLCSGVANRPSCHTSQFASHLFPCRCRAATSLAAARHAPDRRGRRLEPWPGNTC